MRNDPRSFLFLRLGYGTGQSTHMYGQWKHFGRTLLGCTGAAWLPCRTGIIPIDQDRFPVLVALVFLFFVVTAVFINLMLVARREGKNLERKAIAIRAEMAAAKLAAKME